MTTDKNNAAPDPRPAELAEQQGVGITDTQIDSRLNALYRQMVDSGQHNGGMSGVAWDRAVYRAAHAATGKQQVGEVQVGEVQGDALLESLVARWRKDAEEAGTSDNTLCQKIANCTMRHAAELQAALAARQPGAQLPVGQVRTRVDGGFIAELFPAVADRVSNMAPLYIAPPAQGIDLGQQQDAARWRAIAPHLSVEWDEDDQLKRWTWLDFKGDAPNIPSPTRQEYTSVDEAVDALIRQRDAAPGVDRG